MVGKAARLVAPIALAAVAVGVYMLVHTALAKHHPAAARSAPTALSAPHHPRRKVASPKFYLVKQGDTLSVVAAKTHVSQSRLASLNPSVSAPPYSLQTGQVLRLRR